MRNEKPAGSKQLNILQDIHIKLTYFPTMFRERVCEECNWSTPTFYRKIRSYDRPSTTERGKIIPGLSNAEKQKILEVLEEGFMQVAKMCLPYMKNIHISQGDSSYK